MFLKKGANQCITRGQVIAPLKNRGIFNEGAIQWGANQRTPHRLEHQYSVFGIQRTAIIPPFNLLK